MGMHPLEVETHNETKGEKEESIIMNTEERNRAASLESVYKGGNPVKITFLILKSFVGAGILALPFSFYHVGTIPGTITLVLAGLANYYGIFLVCKVADKFNFKEAGYERLAEQVLGRTGWLIVMISLSLTLVTIILAYLTFLGSMGNLVFCELKVELMCHDPLIYTVISYLVAIPIIIIVSQPYFYNIPAFISCFIIIVSCLAIIIHIIVKDGNDSVEINLMKANYTFATKFYGSASFAFEGIPMTFVIRNSMREPRKYICHLNIAMIALGVLYFTFSSVTQFVRMPFWFQMRRGLLC